MEKDFARNHLNILNKDLDNVDAFQFKNMAVPGFTDYIPGSPAKLES